MSHHRLGRGVVERIMKTVFTTGEAAKICKVSQQTIIRCFDSGQLKGFRVPGSRFRRIPRDQLYSFMRDNGIPTDALDSGKRKILVVDDDEDLVELIVDQLEPRWPVRRPQREQRLRRRHADQGVSTRPGRARRDASRYQRHRSLPARAQRQDDGRCADHLHLGHGRRRQDSATSRFGRERLPQEAVRCGSTLSIAFANCWMSKRCRTVNPLRPLC